MGEAWYVRMGDAAVGPRTREEVERMHGEGTLEASTLVWREGTPAWVAYADSGLGASGPPSFPASPPPLPAAAMPTPADAFAQAFAARNAGAGPRAPGADAARTPMNQRGWTPRRATLALAHPQVPGMPVLAVDDDGWQSTAPAPWRRYFGRMLDIVLFGAPVWMAIGFVVGYLSPALHDRLFGAGGIVGNLVVSTVLTCMVTAPVLALLVGLSGTSPGKWIFGTRITGPDGRPIGFRDALARECNVLVSGLALGIPFISLFTLVASKSRLSGDGVTGWDERKPWLVTHREAGPLQAVLSTAGVATWIGANVALRMLLGDLR
ncbi:MAG TPA: RDD family protein [Luteimonas sp.]|nr:RDD family protein [Luteimonas sp.]